MAVPVDRERGTARRRFSSRTIPPLRFRRPPQRSETPEKLYQQIEHAINDRRLDAPVQPGYESHQPVLIELLRRLPGARVLELGVGFGSTPIVFALSGWSLSLETDRVWFSRIADWSTADHRIELWRARGKLGWDCAYLDEPWDVAFIDNAPGTSRQGNLMRLATCARFIVCHDTEECFVPALSDYRWDFTSFPHSWTFTGSATYTTVVSMTEQIPFTLEPGISCSPGPRARSLDGRTDPSHGRGT
jgi:hypothetical protein